MRFEIHKTAPGMIRKLLAHRSMIWTMAVAELRRRYVGTFGGLVWSVIHPFMLVLVYWFVFSVGFKVQPLHGAPFVVVFFSAFTVWSLFSETVNASTNAIVGSSYLCKKYVFPTEVLPVVHLTAAFISHAIMVAVLLILMAFHGIAPSIYNLQILYYGLGVGIFALGFGWFLAAANVFYRDTAQILSVVLNVWFWMTPIVWPIDILPASYLKWIKLNPLYYAVQGYKNSFIYHRPLWEDLPLGMYFWATCGIVLLLGGHVFRRLKPEFAEAL